MAQYTEHFGLHQWESADPFLRTDFNQDLETIDAALGRTARSTEANAYNLYNLMLQSYYEGKYTGYRRGMLLSTFREPGSFTKSPELVLSGGCLSLYGQGQGDIDLGYGDKGHSGSDRTTPEQRPAGGGAWTGFTCQVSNSTSSEYNLSVRARALVNGVETAVCVQSTGPVAPRSLLSMRMDWDTPILVGTRDICAVNLQMVGGNVISICPSPANNDAGGIFHITPLTGSAGWLRADYVGVPDTAEAKLWVRHTGGVVTAAVTDGDGARHTLEQIGQETVLSPEGNACLESTFAGTAVFAGGDWSLALTLARSDEMVMEVFDYGMFIR